MPFFPFFLFLPLLSSVAAKNTNAVKRILGALYVITSLGIWQMLPQRPSINRLDRETSQT